MQGPAYVNSISAVQDFRNALVMYVSDSKQGVAALEIEIRRACDWIAVDRAQFWRSEIRRAGEAVARAKDELHAARTFKRMDDYVPSCIEEKKALQRAEQRLKIAEAKAEAVKKWTRVIQHELNEYIGRMAQFAAVLEIDVPNAMATLDRVLSALDDYVATHAPRPIGKQPVGESESAASMAMPLDEQKTEDARDAARDLTASSESAMAAEAAAADPATIPEEASS